MEILFQAYNNIRDFMETGGPVLYVIMGVTFIMWVLILERFWYFRTAHKRLVADVMQTWNARADTTSWYAHQIRDALISQVSASANKSILMIQTLVALCPLLGLLGTVTGMIEVFEVMALVGSGNARAMAAGVSKATLPTMAGMVAALSGLYLASRLESYASAEAERMGDQLVHH